MEEVAGVQHHAALPFQTKHQHRFKAEMGIGKCKRKTARILAIRIRTCLDQLEAMHWAVDLEEVMGQAGRKNQRRQVFPFVFK